MSGIFSSGVARGSFFPSVDLTYSKRIDNTTIPVPVSDTDRAAQLQVSLDIPLGGKNLEIGRAHV